MSTSGTNALGAAQLQWQKQVKEALTFGEWGVVKLAARGLKNPEIAAAMFKSEDTIKTQLRMAMEKLRPFASQADVLSVNRTGLAVICLRAGQIVKTPCPPPWAMSMNSTLTTFDHRVATMAAEVETDGEFAQRLAVADMPGQPETLYQKVAPFLADAGVEELDREGLVGIFVRAGTVDSPAMHRQWRSSVRSLVSEREHDVLLWLAKGLPNQQIGEKLELSRLTIKAHLARVTRRLEPYGSLVGIQRPRNRTGLAVMTVLAGLDRSLR